MPPATGDRRRALVLVLALAICLCLLRIDDASPAMGPTARAQPPTAGADGGTPVGAGRQVLSCGSRPGSVVSAGTSAGRKLALTFDDGPSLTQTPRILSILDRFGVHATFFEEGRHVHGREALMRQILAGGDEIANHSFDHPRDPGFGELARTNRYIRRATGFEPCLFRPPYGLLDPKVVAAARRAGLQIVLWSLDSGDTIPVPRRSIATWWRRPGRAGSFSCTTAATIPRPSGHCPESSAACAVAASSL